MCRVAICSECGYSETTKCCDPNCRKVHEEELSCFKCAVSTFFPKTDKLPTIDIALEFVKRLIKYSEYMEFNNCSEAVQENCNNKGFVLKQYNHKRNYFQKEFRQIKSLGKGSYGEVFKVVNISDNKSYAIKKICIDISLKNHNIKEIEILRILNSPYTIGYKKSWLEKMEHLIDIKISHYLYIQMELCSNTLEELNQRLLKELNCKQTIIESSIGLLIFSEIMKQIIAGVDYLHRNNIIHRDLNPKNILITELIDGIFVKIADFGISIIDKSNNEFPVISHTGDVGNFDYMAPELSRWSDRDSGRLVYDNKVDIYSLGIIFGEYIKYDSDFSSNNKTKTTELKLILKRLIERMKEKMPETRPKSSELMSVMEKFPVILIDCNYFRNNVFENIRELYYESEITDLTKIWCLDFMEKYSMFIKKY